MKLAARMLMTMVLVGGMAVIANAQPGGGNRGGRGGAGGGFGGGTSRMALLRMEAVQKELGLTEEQITAIGKLQEGNRGPGGAGGRGEGRPGGEGGQRRRGGDRAKSGDEASATAPAQWYFVQDEQPRRGQISEEDRAKFRKEAEERAAKQKEELAKILKPDQAKRLREIYIQVAGVAALNDSEVADELKITSEQKEKLAKVREEMGTSMREAFSGGGAGGDREAMRTKMEEMRKSNEEKTLAVLTADQKAKFEEMKGKKFDMPENARGGGRRPGGDKGGKDNQN